MKREVYSKPAVRKLRVYAFDPQASTKLETAGVNVATIKLPWEQPWETPLEPGPVNEYLEVIDVDPVSGQFYEPVDLNHQYLLAQDGLAPSEGDPRFHQQMVFAVAMKTILTFERALGRRVFWAASETGERVPKLRVYPHALREPNAYYSREKKALLFGYFKASSDVAGASWVFTALSHDIVVHETTHAILDGLHRTFADATHVDSLAFHEAFADIVALLSHFTLEEAVRAEIACKGGRLDERSLMSGLARQFGQATGRFGALRDAIGAGADDRLSVLSDSLTEPHERGSVLVAAVFDAFLTIYQRRTVDLLRIANVRLDPTVRQDLHPDLVTRLAREASKTAEHVMRMCIRALDYLPPIDVRFGEFLRAIVTADDDLVPDDVFGYRLAMIEAFRRRGIVPEGCLSLAPDSLKWEHPDILEDYSLNVKEIEGLNLDFKSRRSDSMDADQSNSEAVKKWMKQSDGEDSDRRWQRVCGVVFKRDLIPEDDRLTISHWPGEQGPEWLDVEIHSVRTTSRAGPNGEDLRQLIIEVAQPRRGFLDKKNQEKQDDTKEGAAPAAPDFTFYGGATLLFDLREGNLRYAIRKRISDDYRLEGQRAFLENHASAAFGFVYGLSGEAREPFALVHRGG